MSCKSNVLQCNQSENLENYSDFNLGVTKIPIILSEFETQVFIETIIKFPEPVFQVKSLEKNVFLNKCELILDTNKLFIRGFIKEDVEYATASTIRENIISGNIKKSTFNIPFQCSIKVPFTTPILAPRCSSSIELGIINPTINSIGISEKNYEYFGFFNEKVCCELDSIEIMETSRKENISLLENTLEKSQIFENIRKKIILTLKLNLIQDKKIFISNQKESSNSLQPFSGTIPGHAKQGCR
ncbi:hypothetical protein [Clostridium sulfidigenes]|uniref:hypothetical protein n=1 Tax=Clostridium sulfidigenes TaxID=318464 RepID=UPI000B2CAF9A|nr:hypothetical protein [Clostridium sulfidigenes]